MIYTKDKDTKVQFRVNSFYYDQLKIIADKNNISVSLLVRNILIQYLSKEIKQDANL